MIWGCLVQYFCSMNGRIHSFIHSDIWIYLRIVRPHTWRGQFLQFINNTPEISMLPRTNLCLSVQLVKRHLPVILLVSCPFKDEFVGFPFSDAWLTRWLILPLPSADIHTVFQRYILSYGWVNSSSIYTMPGIRLFQEVEVLGWVLMALIKV